MMVAISQFPAMNEWACHTLNSSGIPVIAGMKEVCLTPWSKVYSIATKQGTYYLKQPSPHHNQEVNILAQLSQGFTGFIPKVIAKNPTLNCFLMEDAGINLRELLREKYNLKLAKEAIKRYTTIQTFSAHLIDELLNAGVEDWRLNNFTDCYDTFFFEKEFLLDDGMSEQDMQALLDLAPSIAKRVEKLASYNIPECLEHGDFHDNNILVKDKTIVIADWADATISHPFFSMISFLHSAEKQHGIKKAGRTYKALKKAYLQAFAEHEPMERLEEAYALAEQLNPVHVALNHFRILLGSTPEKTEQYRGLITSTLKQLICSLS